MTTPRQSSASGQAASTPTGALGPHQPIPVPADATWGDAIQVLRRYGNRSRMWLERKLKNDPEFPKPTYFGRMRFWKVVELDAYDRVCEARTRARAEQHRNS
jgi:hypothetical protein